MIYLFNVIQLLKDFNFEFICVAFEFLIFPALYANYFEFFKALISCLEYIMKLNSCVGVGGSGGLRAFCASSCISFYSTTDICQILNPAECCSILLVIYAEWRELLNCD